jgi:hypothetical protein
MTKQEELQRLRETLTGDPKAYEKALKEAMERTLKK